MRYYAQLIVKAVTGIACTPFIFMYIPIVTVIGFLADDPDNAGAWAFYGWVNWVTFGRYTKK